MKLPIRKPRANPGIHESFARVARCNSIVKNTVMSNAATAPSGVFGIGTPLGIVILDKSDFFHLQNVCHERLMFHVIQFSNSLR